MNAAGQDEFIPTRNSLLSRLRDWDDQEGWREFFDTYWKFLYAVAVKAGLSDADAPNLHDNDQAQELEAIVDPAAETVAEILYAPKKNAIPHGIATDSLGTVFVCGHAPPAQGSPHWIVRRADNPLAVVD